MVEPEHQALGIDIGGTGIKAAIVDTRNGRLTSRRNRLNTPRPATAEGVTATVRELFDRVDPAKFSAVGVGFPSAIKDGRAMTAVNMDDSWLDVRPGELIGQAIGLRVAVLNDADAAGLAEVRFGAARGISGTVVLITLGTGIGTSLFRDGVLIPNAELARVRIKGKEAQRKASESARKRRGVSWEEWAADVEAYLQELEQMIWPDLVLIGGGASARAHFFMHHIDMRMPVRPARFRNDAGIIGAATYAADIRSGEV
ncbi:MAG: ROK family protein [Dehalococcoidia bacterium]